MSKKILLIEDVADIVTMVLPRLRNQGYEVIVANDGVDGLEKVMTEKPDLIILDVLMPKMDGYTFIKEFKKIGTLEATPVIVLTAQDKLQDIFKQEGIKDYIVKPFEAAELLDAIKKYFV